MINSDALPLLFQQACSDELVGIKGVAFDIDDTFSSKGKITSSAYQALWDLYKSGIFLVAVTGRPAGWCDHISRFWPVDAVIGENGAFIFYMDQNKRCRFDPLGHEIRPQLRQNLIMLEEKIRQEFPYVQFASDQAYREYDLAIDFCEDVPAWKEADIKRLVDLCQREGANCKVSSIHVNTWYGDFDKQKTFKLWLENHGPNLLGVKTEIQDWIYIGDSPNDSPAFSFFPNSVGVANVKGFLSQMDHWPKWITLEESGEGFCELARRLIDVKSLG